VDLVEADVQRLWGVERPRHGVGIAGQASLRDLLDGLTVPAHERMFAHTPDGWNQLSAGDAREQRHLAAQRL
jgi:hypothetical protein